MRPLKLMWNVGVKYPAKAAGFLALLELEGWSNEAAARRIKKKHDKAGSLNDIPPAANPRALGANHIAVDVQGSVLGRVRSEHQDFVNSLKHVQSGLVLVTARFEAGSDGRKAIAAYVQGHHVGRIEPREHLLSSDWEWIKGLYKGGVLPRFAGEVIDFGGTREVFCLLPRWSDKQTARQIRNSLRPILCTGCTARQSIRTDDAAFQCWRCKIVVHVQPTERQPKEDMREWLDRIRRANAEAR